MTLREAEELAKFNEEIQLACESYSQTIRRALRSATPELKANVLAKSPSVSMVIARAKTIAIKQKVDAKTAAMESYDFLLDLDANDKKNLRILRESIEK